VVEAGHVVAGRFARHGARRRRYERQFVLAFCDGGYTSNLPLADVRDGKAWIAYEYEDEPLDPNTAAGSALVPRHYFWKSAKWVRGIELGQDDTPGFLGGLRLPQLRRPLERAALSG
jgi:Sulfite oxidase and related enzymes